MPKKDIIEEQSINERNIEILKQHFPNAIETDEEGKIIVNAQKLQMARRTTPQEEGRCADHIPQKRCAS